MVEFGAEIVKTRSSAHSSIFDEWAERASAIWPTLDLDQETVKSSTLELVRKSSDWGDVESKKLNGVGDIHAPWGTPTLAWKEGEKVKLYRQLAVRPFEKTDRQSIVLLLREDSVSARISFVWLTTMSRALVRSIVLVNVHLYRVGIGLIRALGYFIWKKYEGGYGGVVGTEALLVWWKRKRVKFWLQKAF